MQKPSLKPKNPCFSSGPCPKRPGWSFDGLKDALLGRSHRSGTGVARVKEVIEKHRSLLGIPADYRLAVVPASDTGAIEMAMWSMLGPRPVDVLAWEVFGKEWVTDITKQLKVTNTVHKADFGALPDLSKVNFDNDVVFTWNGTTSGVCVPDGNWIAKDRKGLTFCDATSAVFAYDMPWERLDVTTWSWQKALGGEAAHGMLALSPRAVERLTTFSAPRPLPKIFRMTADGKLIEGLFQGESLNTVSMLCVEDCLDALKWVESIGGCRETIRRTKANFDALAKWVGRTSWIDFLACVPEQRSYTSVCMKIVDPWFAPFDDENKAAFIKTMAKLLEKEGVAYDIAAHRQAPAGLRVWCGATTETSDIEALTPWLDWAYETAKAEAEKKAA